MALGWLKKMIIGDYSEKTVKRHLKTVEIINGLEATMQGLSDAQLSGKTAEFKQRLERGESLEQVLPEAFAVVREAARRTLGQRHFDVQLVGGMVLHEGNIAEMKTGEGKTLVATLPAYLNALTGKGVHVVTVNDYLARRDSEWMGQIYRFLGLSVGLIVHGLDTGVRQKSYRADITYGTNNEFGFDYLRDNMVLDRADMVQRPLHYAIVDEVDSILIDEARTPLIISGPADKPTERYYQFAKVVQRLQRDIDYTIDEKTRQVAPTEEGVHKVEKMVGVQHLYEEGQNLSHFLVNALKAKEFYHRDREYVVKDGQVIIVDDFTGRLMFGRRWSDGLHQAVEAKEGVKIERESQTLATITIQNYFRMYKKLAGMTGTAMTEEPEFRQIYGMDVIAIPTNKPMVRKDHPDVVYKTVDAKHRWIVEEIVERYNAGQPVLVGTISIAKSETLSAMLRRRGIPHQVLNAKYHEKEAEIIAQAGRLKAVTIATNMAGRGTDILLGGNPAFLAKESMRQKGFTYEMIAKASEGLHADDPEMQQAQQVYQQLLTEFRQQTDREAAQVRAVGGLHIIGSERHEARRIDNQLRGRSGRQGDPGSSRFYVALEDDLMRLFGGEMVSNIMEKLGIDEDTPIDSPVVSKAIENAQKKVEARNFDIRKHVLQYDDVMNQQRDLIYKQRRKVLDGENLKESVLDMARKVIEGLRDQFCPKDTHAEEWDLEGLCEAVEQALLPKGAVKPADLEDMGQEAIAQHVYQVATDVYEAKERSLGADMMRRLEQIVLLRVVDEKWMAHLDAMDDLRDGIGLRAYGQRDPLNEYKIEAADMFNDMINSVTEDAARLVFKLEVVREEQRRPREMHYSGGEEGAARPQQPVRNKQQVGRNDPCPCGSGKKYKKCHGRDVA